MVPYIFIVLVAACFHSGNANVTPVSDAQKQEIVDSHNEWRKNAGATAMRRIKWNDDLARFAETAASKCAFDHTSNEERQNIGGFSNIGENIYIYSAETTFKAAVDSWGSEEKDYDLATNECSDVCGHYTQITWAKTSDVGCAMSQCSNVEGFGPGYLIFCNYGIAGNMMGEKPFEKGAPGSQCQSEYNIPAGADGLCGEGDSTPSGDGDNPESTTENPDQDQGDDDLGTTENPTDGQDFETTTENPEGDQDFETTTENPEGSDETTTTDDQDNGDDDDDDDDDGGFGTAEECQDEWSFCSDWTRHCGRDWTKWACRKTCKFCGNNGESDSGSDEGQDDSCKDDIWFCNDWLDSCDQDWAKTACRKSCNLC